MTKAEKIRASWTDDRRQAQRARAVALNQRWQRVGHPLEGRGFTDAHRAALRDAQQRRRAREAA